MLKRLKRLWKLAGIEITDPGPKSEMVDKITDIFREQPEPIKRKLATIIKTHADTTE